MDWKIPLCDIDFNADELESVEDVLKSKWLSMGPKTLDFENEFKEYLLTRYVFAVSSGTAALHLALRAIDVKRGDEVILPSLTFVAAANSVLYCNAKPVFADINSEENWNISSEEITDKITKKTKAIMAMHYGGYPCDMKSIMEIAEENNLKVVEDAAHAVGAEIDEKKCGTIGDVGCFSFFANKNMTTGEGGMVVTDDSKIAERVKLLRSHGMTTVTWDRERGHAFSYDVVDLGYNYRINEIASALGVAQLKKLDKNNSKRGELVDKYRKKLERIDNILVPFKNHNSKPSFHIMPILLEKMNREQFMAEMRDRGIQTSIHYNPIHLFTYYRNNLGYNKGDLPLTEYVGGKEVTLPLHQNMSEKDLDYVVESVAKILEARK